MAEHMRGLNYSRGCRCATCTVTHNINNWLYRERNAEAARAAASRGEVRIVDGITHGISGYRNIHCRCEVCCAANRASCVAYRKRRKVRIGEVLDGGT